jgi:hypothetical protein
MKPTRFDRLGSFLHFMMARNVEMAPAHSTLLSQGRGALRKRQEIPMHYMMLIHHDHAALAKANQKELWADYAAFNEALTKAGGRSGVRLEPASAATSVRVRDGKESAELAQLGFDNMCCADRVGPLVACYRLCNLPPLPSLDGFVFAS